MCDSAISGEDGEPRNPHSLPKYIERIVMVDTKLVDDARSLVTVVGSGSVELSHEQLRSAFLKFVPALITELEILNGMRELKMELKPKRKRRSTKKK